MGFAVRSFDLDVAQLENPDALARLITESRRQLVHGIAKISWRLGLRDMDPEDIFQDTVICCFRSVRTMRAETERGFRAWFLGVARNQMLGRLRRRSRGKNDATDKAQAGTELPFPGFETWLGPLPPHGSRVLWTQASQNRSVLLLRELISLSWGDVATVMRRPSGPAARGLHSRARVNIDEPE